MPASRELVGVYLGTQFAFGNDPERRCIIGRIQLPDNSKVVVRGYSEENELLEGLTYRFFGSVRVHPKYGSQFNFSSFVQEHPVDEKSVTHYLAQCESPQRGSLTFRVATLLVNKYGVGAIDALINDPVAAADGISRWDAKKAAMAAEYLKGVDGIRRANLEIIRIIEGQKLPRSTAKNAVKEWGTNAASLIRDDPYILMNLSGIGFKSADAVYCKLAKEKFANDLQGYNECLAEIKRQGLCAWYEIAKDNSGSTWFPIQVAMNAIAKNISNSLARPAEAIKWSVESGILKVRDESWVAVYRKATNEQEIAETVARSIGDPILWPPVDEIADFSPTEKPLSEHQLSAIRTALSGRIGCLQGSPGVGKTFAVSCIIKALQHNYGNASIAACCPTGKAALRLSQMLADNNVKEAQATTIHRMLGVDGNSSVGGWRFNHSEKNPLRYTFIIVDESSMIDVDLMAALMRACTNFTNILFVGDTNQLAPVGHGKPFFDMQSVVPTGHLTEIRRNSGRIVKTCASIRDHRKFEAAPNINLESGDNLALIDTEPEAQVKRLENVMGHISKLNDCNPIWDVQVITALNNRGEISRNVLNKSLQGILNPHGRSLEGKPFRVGDKIVCLENGSYPLAADDFEDNFSILDDEVCFVANGELAEVLGISNGLMKIRLDNPRRTIIAISIPRNNGSDNENGDDAESESNTTAIGCWDLGYALSCHRAQGSQWKYAIVMVDSSSSAKMVQTRNWIYTAISRAELATIVIGKQHAINSMMPRDGINNRKTFLAEIARREHLVCSIDYDSLFARV